MRALRQTRSVSALALVLHLATVAHMSVVGHTLSTSGEVVHAELRPATEHTHVGASLCADRVEPDRGGACDVMDRARATEPLTACVHRSELPEQPDVVEPSLQPRVVQPLAFAPKASPPRA